MERIIRFIDDGDYEGEKIKDMTEIELAKAITDMVNLGYINMEIAEKDHDTLSELIAEQLNRAVHKERYKQDEI